MISFFEKQNKINEIIKPIVRKMRLLKNMTSINIDDHTFLLNRQIKNL